MIFARPVRLSLLFVLFVLLPLGLRPLWIPDESRYAEIAREMLDTGNWVVPQLLGMHYFEKPVAGYWFIAFSQGLFGGNEFASRLPSALATAISAVTVALLAHRLWHDQRKTWIAVLVYLSFALVSGMAMYITLDPQLACWLNVAMLCFVVAATTDNPGARLAAWVLFGAACGMAFLTKGFVAWVLPALVVVPYMFWRRQVSALLRYGTLAALVAIAVATPWGLAVHREAPDFWNQFFWNEHVRRFAAENAQHDRPAWFYLPVLALGCLPWLGLLVPTLRRAWTDRRDPMIGLLICWFLVPLAFLSVARGKLPTYILPCFTPLALLFAHTLAHPRGQPEARWIKVNAAINCTVGLAALVALVMGARSGLYETGAHPGWLWAIAVGLAWLLSALAQWWRPLRFWELAALPMWLLWASLPQVLSQPQLYSKQPSAFIESHGRLLRDATFLLGNESGLSSSLAWGVGRADIIMYSGKGELEYGLHTPGNSERYVAREAIGPWIEAARRRGSVAVVLRVRGDDDPDLTALPAAAAECDLRDRLALVFYPRLGTP